MTPRLGFFTRAGVHGQLRFARLLELPERDFEDLVRKLESKELFKQLLDRGVVAIQPFSQAAFTARRFGGWGLRSPAEGLPQLLDAQGDLAQLMGKVGQERFQECFLDDERRSDDERARLCGISRQEASRLRELVDKLYVQSEFEDSSKQAAPAKIFSTVAGISIEQGRPVLAFFHREVWKGRYRIDEKKREALLAAADDNESRKMESLLRELDFVDRRKSTLYRVLEALLEAQSEFLLTGEPDRRRALTQRAVGSKLDIIPSVLNRLISNKSVQLPWGLEAPLKAFTPSAKSLIRDRLYTLAVENPDLSDEGLCREVGRLHGAKLSRRSASQYRKELGLGGQGAR